MLIPHTTRNRTPRVSKLHVPGTQRRSNHTLSQLQETSEVIKMKLIKDKLKDMDSITQKNGPW